VRHRLGPPTAAASSAPATDFGARSDRSASSQRSVAAPDPVPPHSVAGVAQRPAQDAVHRAALPPRADLRFRSIAMTRKY
jgi:hypothetical protein